MHDYGPRLSYTEQGRAYAFTEADVRWFKEIHDATGIYSFDCKIALANANGCRMAAAISLTNAFPSHAASISRFMARFVEK